MHFIDKKSGRSGNGVQRWNPNEVICRGHVFEISEEKILIIFCHFFFKTRRKNEELKKQIDDKKKETERKKREAEDARMREQQEQIERERQEKQVTYTDNAVSFPALVQLSSVSLL